MGRWPSVAVSVVERPEMVWVAVARLVVDRSAVIGATVPERALTGSTVPRPADDGGDGGADVSDGAAC